MSSSRRAARGRGLAEVAGVGAVYFVYDWLRDQLMGSEAAAFRNAKQIIGWERALGFYRERPIQHAFLHADAFLGFWNLYYGTIHFVLPVVGLVWLYRVNRARYFVWRNTLFVMLAIGLLGFWLYPLMPPRLLPHHYGFVDTAFHYFNFGGKPPSSKSVEEFGNLYAAMPSLHIGWSTWSVCVLVPLVQRRWVRVLLVLYPVVTTFAIVVTANHYLLDAVGGLLALGLAYTIAKPATVWWMSHSASASQRPESEGFPAREGASV